jgi:nitrate/nitrite-specific signal transduction histidine kinase
LVALLTFASGVIGLLELQQAFAASAMLVQSTEMIMAVQEIRVAIGPVPGPVSDFLLTGDPTAPERYAAAIAEVHTKLAAYAAAHQLHRHSAAHALSAHDLISATTADVDNLEEWGQAAFEADDRATGLQFLQEIEQRAATSTEHLDALLRNAEEDIQAAQVARAAAERNALVGLSASAILAVTLALGLAIYSTYQITTPLAQLARAADRMASGDLSSAVDVKAVDEIKQLAAAFERMRQILVRERDQVRLLAVLEERDRIGREMHDGLAQVLGYVNTKAQAVREFLKAGQPNVAERNIEELVTAAREAYTDAREAITNLRMEDVRERGLAEMLAEHVERFRKQSGILIELTISADWDDQRISPTVKVQLLRVAQEALTNVRQHAAAQNVRVALDTNSAQARVRVEDDGHGFYLSRLLSPEYSHYGLRTMRERAHAVGGTFRIESMPGKGTRIIVHVPLEQPGEEQRA